MMRPSVIPWTNQCRIGVDNNFGHHWELKNVNRRPVQARKEQGYRTDEFREAANRIARIGIEPARRAANGDNPPEIVPVLASKRALGLRCAQV